MYSSHFRTVKLEFCYGMGEQRELPSGSQGTQANMIYNKKVYFPGIQLILSRVSPIPSEAPLIGVCIATCNVLTFREVARRLGKRR